jgi:hypothetical protein
VWKTFQLEGSPPQRQGVGPHQPSPFGESKRLFARALLAVAALVVLYLGFLAGAGRTVHRESVRIPPAVGPGAPEAAVFAGPFEVPADSNLEVKVEAPVSNSWLYLEGALINDDTGAVDEFDVEVSYYTGVDSDGSWSEGGTSEARFIPAVPAGRYTLRLAPQWETGQRPVSGYDLVVRNRVPRFYHLFLATLALLAWPALRLWRYFRFETERWSESDHPWVESSDDDDSSEDE